MAYKVIILYQLYMPSYFLGTFTEYPYIFTIGRLSDPKKSTRREHRFYKLYGLYKLYNSKAPCLFGSFS